MTANHIYRWSRLVTESMEEQPELLKEDIEKQDLTLREFFDRAVEENAELKVTFIKVTNKERRVAVFSTAAGKPCHFDDQVRVSPKVLKTINRNHDRVFSQHTEYTGSLVTFPEKITETSNITQPARVFPAEDGSEWQWRRLYVQQIEKLEFNGRVVWENNGLFEFNLVGRDGEILTTLSKDEYDRQQDAVKNAAIDAVKNDAEKKAYHDKVVAVAKTMSERDCSVDLGWVNGWIESDPDEKLRRDAIIEKHNQLCHQNPDKHEVGNISSYTQRERGFDHYKCKGCDFSYSIDSSD